MGRRLLVLSLTLIGCSGGSMPQTCPDGEPVNVLRNVEDVYPVYIKEYDVGFNVATNQLAKIALDAKLEATVKTRAIRLRQELDQERAELENQQKSVVVTLQTAPCDKEMRKKAMDFLVDIKTKTNRIPDRMKEFNEQASTKLQSDVSNLLHYPDAARDSVPPPTMIEAMLVDKLPRRLFDLLFNYNDTIILNVPKVGVALRDHKIAYYGFRQKVSKLEDSLLTRIGDTVPVRFREGWRIYLQYAIMRFGGSTQQQIVARGNFLNYEITWDDCERTFVELSKDQLSKAVVEALTSHSSLAQGVSKISNEI